MVLPVALSVYDVVKPSKSKSSSMAALVKLNTMTAGMRFGGCFHGGMVVDGIEWSFGYSARSSGVYCVEPGKNPQYRFRETISLGTTSLNSQQVREVLRRMREKWIGPEYDLLAHNCCHFCEAFAQELGCKAPPGWLNRFAQSADVARSLGARSAQVLRNSLAKVLVLNHDSKNPESRSPSGRGSTPSTSLPTAASSEPGWTHDYLLPARRAASGHSETGFSARSAEHQYSILTGSCGNAREGEGSMDSDPIEAMFARQGLRASYMPLREGCSSDHEAFDTSQEDDGLLAMFARRARRPSAPPSHDSGSDSIPSSAACFGSLAIENMFTRPASLLCEEAYLFGLGNLRTPAVGSPAHQVDPAGVVEASGGSPPSPASGQLMRQDQLLPSPTPQAPACGSNELEGLFHSESAPVPLREP